VTNWILHNCVRFSSHHECDDSQGSKKMRLKTSMSYKNMCTFNSHEIPLVCLIKDIQVHLVAHPDVFVNMDIVVLDVLKNVTSVSLNKCI